VAAKTCGSVGKRGVMDADAMILLPYSLLDFLAYSSLLSFSSLPSWEEEGTGGATEGIRVSRACCKRVQDNIIWIRRLEGMTTLILFRRLWEALANTGCSAEATILLPAAVGSGTPGTPLDFPSEVGLPLYMLSHGKTSAF
jgi:hypothetical protein